MDIFDLPVSVNVVECQCSVHYPLFIFFNMFTK